MTVALNLRSKAPQPVDGDDGWKAPKKPAIRPASPAPVAESRPTRVDVGTLPTTLAAQIQRHAATATAALKRQQDQRQARLELMLDDAKRAALQARAAGTTPAPSDDAAMQQAIADLEAEIASFDTQIAYVQQRAQEQIERSAPLLTELVEGTERMVQILGSLKPVYDALVKRADDFRSLMTYSDPNTGRVSLVGLPQGRSGDSVLSVLHRLEPIFGKDEMFTRVQREARAAGLNGDAK